MFQLMLGDCITEMKTLPDQSVHTCVTSPPYFGLRDYGTKGQIGLEATPEAFVSRLVEVFREVRRVLRDDGTLWLNLGDSYANGGRKYRAPDKKARSAREMSVRPTDGAKPKDLLGVPWRVAFALQADGWYLRQDIIWHKPNPMPESVTDRCTKAHEYLFLLSKSPKYYFDSVAIKEESVDPAGSAARYKGAFGDAKNEHFLASDQVHTRSIGMREFDGKRNRRSVWTVTTKPYAGAHFATFPPDLIEPCILAGCPVGGTVLDPFGGSGTTAGVALKHGRRALLCEVNPDYGKLMPSRIELISGMSSDAWSLI